MTDVVDRAARIVEEAGLIYLFGGGPATDLPNLHTEITGRDAIVEWDADTDAVWRLRGGLPARGAAWYGEWLRNRGTFVAIRLLPAALAWMDTPADEVAGVDVARSLSEDAGMLYESLLIEGPLSSVELRHAVGLTGPHNTPAFSRGLSALRRRLLITTVGTAARGSSWESAVYELTARALPLADLPDRDGALGQLLVAYRSAAQEPTPLGAARLFRTPVASVRSAW